MFNPVSEIGEMMLSFQNQDFLFKPSLKNVYKIGTPKEIVEIYALLHGKEIRERLPHILTQSAPHQAYFISILNSPAFGRKILQGAMNVLACCCEQDISVLVGEWKPSKSGIRYVLGKLPPKSIIQLAQRLLEHGMIGCCPLLIKESTTPCQFSESFEAQEYINLARTYFNMGREEAENLTMTELQQLLKSQMPTENKKARHFTEAEYNKIMEEYYNKK